MDKLSQGHSPTDYSCKRNECSIDEQKIRKMEQLCPVVALERFAYEALGTGADLGGKIFSLVNCDLHKTRQSLCSHAIAITLA